jgi:hypothetical protein
VSQLNVITGRVTNPGATLTALTPDTGDSFTVKNFDSSERAWIIAAWAQAATAGVLRIRSPQLHDVGQGIRLRTSSAAARNLLPYGIQQRLRPQDVLTVEGSGGGAETDVFSFLAYYQTDNLPSARFIGPEELDARMVNLFGAEVQVTSSATAGQYGGSTALSATFDVFKRGLDYAMLGILSDTAGCSVGITGPDTGQTRLGQPMTTEPLQGHNWFVDLSVYWGLPLIPVFNAANVGNTNIDCATTSASATVNFTVILAELSGGPGVRGTYPETGGIPAGNPQDFSSTPPGPSFGGGPARIPPY